MAIGMLCASRLAESLQLVDHAFTDRQYRLLTALGLPVEAPPVDTQVLLSPCSRTRRWPTAGCALSCP